MVRDPVMVDPDTPCRQQSRLMRNKGIGSVVVVKDGFPVGVVTERDLVHRILAEGRDPDKCDADQVCTKPVVAISIYGDVDMAVKEAIEAGVNAVWPSCDIWPTAPRENMEAMMAAARKYGKLV